jgi:hypothetical protein
MGEFPRKADGRRVFTPEFKRQVLQTVPTSRPIRTYSSGNQTFLPSPELARPDRSAHG